MHPAGPSSSPPGPYAMPPYPPQHPGQYPDYAYQQQPPQQMPMYAPQFIPPYPMMWPHPPPPPHYQPYPPQYPQLSPQPPHMRPYQPRGQGGYRGGGRGRRGSSGGHMGGPSYPQRGMLPTSPGGPSPAQPPMPLSALPSAVPPMVPPIAPGSVGAFYQPIPTPPSPPESLLPPTPQPASSSSPSPESRSTSHTPTPTSPITAPESAPSPNRTPKATPPTISSVLEALPSESIRIHLARYRPSTNAAGGITIAQHLSDRSTFPSALRDAAVTIPVTRPRPIATRQRRPAPASTVVTPAPTTPSSAQASLTSAAVSSIPTTPSTTNVKTPSVASASSAQVTPSRPQEKALPAEERAEPPKPAPAPKPKPNSWAGLFRPAGASAPPAAAVPAAASSHTREVSNASTFMTAPTSPVASAQPGSTVTSPRQEAPVRRRPAAKVDLERLVADGSGILDEVLKQGEQWRAALTVPTGLWNTGNLCFANCILQTLVYCGPFYELIMEIGQRIGGAVGGRTPFLDAIVLFLRQIPVTTSPDPWKARLDEVEFPGLGGATGEAAETEVLKRKEPQGMVPDFVYSGMSDYPKSKQILRGGQEDADEFFCFLLDVLEEELLTVLKIFSANPTPASASSARTTFGKQLAPVKPEDELEVKRPVSPAFAARGGEDGDWTEVGKRNKKVVSRSIQAAETAITKMFCLKTRTVDRRPGAKDTVLIEPQQRLSLSVIDEKITNIEQALLAFSTVETVEQSGLTRQVMLDTLPPVLVIHLQRWGRAGNGRWEKTEKEISIGQTLEIPNEVLSPARRSATLPKYRLFAVLYHDGLSAQHGHYTLDVLRQDCSEWIHYDNEQISLASRPGEEKLRDGRVAYMLYYLRIA